LAVADDLERRDGSVRSADGTELFWRSWELERPKATFAVIHGLGEHSGRYQRFAEAMAERGYSTFAVDLRGMGRSAGRRGHVDRWSEWVKDAETFVGHVEDHPSAGEVIPLGHSFGGVVVLSGVLHDALQPRRFVLSCPALQAKVRVPGWKAALGRAASVVLPNLTMSNEVRPSMLSRIPEVVQGYTTDPLVHDQISSRLFTEWQEASAEIQRRAVDFRTPFFISLGGEDGLIDSEASLDFARRAVNAPHEVRVWEGRYHEPFNDLDSDEVFDAIAAWLG
jgi:alpha-beta hydrolase superfamily lysophospholipase